MLSLLQPQSHFSCEAAAAVKLGPGHASLRSGREVSVTTCKALEASPLGTSSLAVSKLCFGEFPGSMCWGTDPPAADADAAWSSGTMLFGTSTDHSTAALLLASAVDEGINFFDTAEMYPVPQSASTQGRSEEVLGEWLVQQRRSGSLQASSWISTNRCMWALNL